LSKTAQIIFPYQIDGYDSSGKKIPDIPIIYLLLKSPTGKKISGPAIIDTGFDGSLFANDALVLFLSDLPKENEKIIGGFGSNEFICELFKIQAYLADNNTKIIKDLGQILVYVPIQIDYLSEYVIIGRELLNRLNICLNGRKTTLIV